VDYFIFFSPDVATGVPTLPSCAQ